MMCKMGCQTGHQMGCQMGRQMECQTGRQTVRQMVFLNGGFKQGVKRG
jgi:hypothetical protein